MLIIVGHLHFLSPGLALGVKDEVSKDTDAENPMHGGQFLETCLTPQHTGKLPTDKMRGRGGMRASNTLDCDNATCSYLLQQLSPTFLAPGMGFVEDNFSPDTMGWGGVEVWFRQ